MYLPNFAGPVIFLASTLIMLLVVPWDRIRSFVGIGLIGGLVVAFALIYFMQNLFGFWTFHQVDLINLGRIPIFLSLAWLPLTITFCHLITNFKTLAMIGLTLIAFPIGASLTHYFLIKNYMLFYHNWNLYLTFLVSLVIHISFISYLYFTKRLTNLDALVQI